MSHQSGVTSSDALDEVFAESLASDKNRLIKIDIDPDSMTLIPSAVRATDKDWDIDYEAFVLDVVEKDRCCFIMFRLDTTNAQGYDWIFTSFSPDFAAVRDKMVYASTRATLKSLINPAYIKQELFGTVPEDIDLDGYEKHLESEAAPAPLSMEEQEKKELQRLEVGVDVGSSTRKAMVATGIAFPVDEEGRAELSNFKEGKVDFVQFMLDIDGEIIKLTQAGNLAVDEAGALCPADQARYCLYKFKHNHEGEELATNLFVYSCPAFELPVRDRMLYASCKSPLLDIIEGEFEIEIVKKMEIENGTEFTHEEFYSTLHPVAQVHALKFSRPKGPGGRRPGGSRRPTRGSSGSAPGGKP